MKKETITKKELFGIILIILLFSASAILSRVYAAEIEHFIGTYDLIGIITYISVTIVATVIAPMSTLPLLPVAAAAWGSFLAALFSIFSWTVGSIIAFIIARRYGKPIVSRFLDIHRVELIKDRLSSKHIFWSVLFARMVIPVDILSYAIGLFVPIGLFPYTIATILGVAPFAFIFSYAATTSFTYIVIVGVFALVTMYLGYKYLTKEITPKKRR